MFQEFKINNLEQFPQDLDILLNQQREKALSSNRGRGQKIKPTQDNAINQQMLT